MTPKEAVAVLAAAFRQERLEAPTIALYEKLLADLEPGLLHRAIHQVVKSCKFFPAIAEIRDAAAELSGQLPARTEEALAIIRQADVERPVYRRDGTFAYNEYEWRWPEDVAPSTMAVIQETLAKVGESRTPDGKPVFGWDLGFKASYERTRAAYEPDLSRPALPPPSTKPPAELPPGEPPPPEFKALIDGLVERKRL